MKNLSHDIVLKGLYDPAEKRVKRKTSSEVRARITPSSSMMALNITVGDIQDITALYSRRLREKS